MPTYCIGDVQGCFKPLKELLKIIAFNPTADYLWFTGDLVNRGPHSLEVLRYIRDLGERAVVVLGNHDFHLLATYAGYGYSAQDDSLEALLAAPEIDDLCFWLRTQPLLHCDLGYVMVHAGLHISWTLAEAQARSTEVAQVLQSERWLELMKYLYGNTPNQWSEQLSGWPRLRTIINYFTRLRFCQKEGAMCFDAKGQQAPTDYYPWFRLSRRLDHDLKIVFGHWAALQGVTDEPNVYALDTGCVWGNCLTAMRLEDQQRFSVPCH